MTLAIILVFQMVGFEREKTLPLSFFVDVKDNSMGKKIIKKPWPLRRYL